MYRETPAQQDRPKQNPTIRVTSYGHRPRSRGMSKIVGAATLPFILVSLASHRCRADRLHKANPKEGSP